MGLKECDIQLDNPWNTYYAGQTINGQVKFTFDSPKTIRGIIIRFLGEANTSWDETKTVRDAEGKETNETEHLTGHEEYFEIHYYLLGAKNGSEINLPAGLHTYPFTCALPPTLPSSFEGEWGHVRYTIKVTLDRPWKFDQDAKMAFTVVSPVDLNVNPRLKEQAKIELEKTFCCCCCASGPLSAVILVPATGFVSGQSIPITAEVDNASNVTVDRLKLILRKTVVFKTTTPRQDIKRVKTVIAETSEGPVEAHGSKTWTKTMVIPPLPPSNLLNCSLIDLDYELKVELNVSGPHKDLEGKIPITLGTIPLTNIQPSAPYTDVVPPPAPYTDILPSPIQDPSLAPTQPVSPASPPPAGASNGSGLPGWNMGTIYPTIPPPSYAESAYKANIVDKNDSQHIRVASGQSEFAPRYPTYTAAALPQLPNFK